MNNTLKRLLSLFMAVAMVMSFAVLPAAAEDTDVPTETTQAPQETGHQHDLREEVTLAATCAAAGVKTISCGSDGCSFTEEVEIPATGAHSYENGFCTTEGCTAEDPNAQPTGETEAPTEETEAVCDGTENCAAQTHETTCECYDWCAALGCTWEVHHADCPWGPCTLTEGCELVKGHPGECTGMATFDGIIDTEEKLAEALIAGTPVTLGADITLSGTGTVNITTPVTIDLNGKSITGLTANAFTLGDSGKLTITGSGNVGGMDPAPYLEAGYVSCYNADMQAYVVGELPVAEVASLTQNGALTLAADEYKIGLNESAQTDLTLPIALQFTAKDDADKAKDNAFGYWNTDFYISLTGVSGTIDLDGCYLVGNYGTWGWIAIPLDDMTINGNTTYPVLGAQFQDWFEYWEICADVQTFKCGIHLTDEVLDANPHMEVNLELRIAPHTISPDAEDPSYIKIGNTYTYDAYALRGEKPAVTISETVTVQPTVLPSITSNAAVNDFAPNVPDDAELVIELKALETDTVTYDVAPMRNGEKVSNPETPITFRLPVPSSITAEYVNVIHTHDSVDIPLGAYKVQGTGNSRYIELTFDKFSEIKMTASTSTSVSNLAELKEALKTAGSTITVTAPITITGEETLDLNGCVVNLGANYIVNHGILTVQNGSLIADTYNDETNGAPLWNQSTGELTIKSTAKLTGFCSALRNQAGTTVIEGGEFTATCNNGTTSSIIRVKGGKLTIIDGTFTGCNSTNLGEGCSLLNVTDSGSAEIKGGTFSNFAAAPASIFGSENADVTVSGGTFHIDNRSDGFTADAVFGNFLAEGHITEGTTGSTVTIKDARVAFIGAKGYTSLQDAINEAKDNDTIDMAKEFTTTDTVTNSKKITLKLNNTTLTTAGIINSGNLTIENGNIVGGPNDTIRSTGTLTLNNVNATGTRHVLRIVSGSAIINSGEYKPTATTGTRHALNVGDDEAPDTNKANVTINGGTFIGPKDTTMDSGSAVSVQNGSTVTVPATSTAVFKNGKNATLSTQVGATLTIQGGTYDQDPSTYVAQDYKAVKNADNMYEVVKRVYVAQVGNDKFESLDAAVTAAANAATEGQTIELLKDVTLTEAITAAVNVTIDTNGFAIKGNGVELKAAEGKTLTLKGLGLGDNLGVKLTGTADVAKVDSNGNLVVSTTPATNSSYGSYQVIKYSNNTETTETVFVKPDTKLSITGTTEAFGKDAFTGEYMLSKNTALDAEDINVSAPDHDYHYTKGTTESLYLESTGFFETCTKIVMQSASGTVYELYNVNPAYQRSGTSTTIGCCTRLTMTSSFLNTLPVGDYTVIFTHTLGQDDAVIHINASPYVADSTNPKTGDAILLPMAVMFTSAAALFVLLMNKKKRA